MTGHRVIGVDGAKDRWVAVALADDRFERAFVVRALTELRAEPADAIAVDVPIGLVAAGWRQADLVARAMLGPRRSSLFVTPPRPVIDAPTFQEAVGRCRSLTGGVAISRQSFALFPKILEAEAARANYPRIFEVHPEVSFATLMGRPMSSPKRAWNGLHARRQLLASVGIELPDAIEGPAGQIPPDDLLDAAVAAWSAARLVDGRAVSMPTADGVSLGASGYIWA